MPRIATPRTPFADEVIYGLIGTQVHSARLSGEWIIGMLWDHTNYRCGDSWVLTDGEDTCEMRVSLPEFIEQLTPLCPD